MAGCLPGKWAVSERREYITAGPAVAFAWDEFFAGQPRNPHARGAKRLAVVRFLDWIAPEALPLERITPGMVGVYFDQHSGSTPKSHRP
jgi:hypothetical protein